MTLDSSPVTRFELLTLSFGVPLPGVSTLPNDTESLFSTQGEPGGASEQRDDRREGSRSRHTRRYWRPTSYASWSSTSRPPPQPVPWPRTCSHSEDRSSPVRSELRGSGVTQEGPTVGLDTALPQNRTWTRHILGRPRTSRLVCDPGRELLRGKSHLFFPDTLTLWTSVPQVPSETPSYHGIS